MLNREHLSSYADAVAKIIILFLSFSFAFLSRPLLHLLPSTSSAGVAGVSLLNPEQNYVQFLLLSACTLLLYFALSWLKDHKRYFFRLTLVILMLISLTIGIFAPTVTAKIGNIDTFHAGEQLSPAQALMNGKKPYSDIFVLRGAGEDIYVPSIALRIFGNTPGSYYLFTTLLQIGSALLFMLLLVKLFKSDIVLMLSLVWFTSSAYAFFYSTRDIFTWIFLSLVSALILAKKMERWKIFIAIYIATLCLFYAFDRGVFLVVLSAIFTSFCLFFTRVNGQYEFLPPKTSRLFLSRIYMPTVAFVSANATAAIILGMHGYLSFFSSNMAASKYQGLIFNYPYPKFALTSLAEWLPYVSTIVIALLLIEVVRRVRRLPPELTVLAFLFVGGVIFFRAATGRPDLGHIAYGAPLLFIAVFYAIDVMIGGTQFRMKKSVFERTAISIAGLFFLMCSPQIFDATRLAAMNQTSPLHLKMLLTAPSKPRDYWFGSNVSSVTSKILSLPNTNKSLFVFSSDPIYYYSTNLNNPTRYYISWFADPSPLEKQMLAELKRNPPAVVLYKSGTYYDSPQFIPMTERLPIVNTWIQENYVPASFKSTNEIGIVILTKR